MPKMTAEVLFPEKGSWKNHNRIPVDEYNRMYEVKHRTRLQERRKMLKNTTVSARMAAMRANAHTRSKTKKWAFDLTTKYLCDLWELQEGKCALTGVQMSLEQSESRWKGSQVSLDRKDASLGYTQGNVWLTTTQANYAKGTQTYEEFLEFCASVLENAKCQK